MKAVSTLKPFRRSSVDLACILVEPRAAEIYMRLQNFSGKFSWTFQPNWEIRSAAHKLQGLINVLGTRIVFSTHLVASDSV